MGIAYQIVLRIKSGNLYGHSLSNNKDKTDLKPLKCFIAACAKIQNQNYHDDSEMKKTRLTAAKRDRQMEKSLEITVGRQDLL